MFCTYCGTPVEQTPEPETQPVENASTEDGLQTYCKECGNVYARNRKKTPGGGI